MRELVDDFLNGYATGSPKTLQFYRDQVGRVLMGFLAERGVATIDQVTAPLLRLYMARESSPERKPRPLASKSIGHRQVSLYTFMEFCRREGHIRENPAALLTRYTVERRIRMPYTADELNRMFKYVHSDRNRRNWIGVRNFAILAMFVDTGARAEELLGVTVDELTLNRDDTGTVLLHGKGGRDRIMDIGKRCGRALKAYVAVRPRIPQSDLWVTLFGDALQYDALRDMLKDLEVYAGVEGIQAHRFRHTFACAHYRANKDLLALRDSLDHQDATTTLNYLRGLGITMNREARYPTPGDWLLPSG